MENLDNIVPLTVGLVPDEVIISLINIELQKYGNKVRVVLFGLV